MKRKKTLIALIISIVVLVTGVSYAYFYSNASGTEQELTATTASFGNLEFTGDKLEYSMDLDSSQTAHAYIKNTGTTGDESIKYSLKLVIEKNDFVPTTDANNDITVQISSPSLSSGTFTTQIFNLPSVGEYTFITDLSIAPGETQEWTTTVSYNETGAVQNVNMGKQFSSHITIFDIKADI